MRAIALAFALALTAAAPSAQSGDPAALLERWVIAVDTHAAGAEDTALAALDSWSYADFNSMRRYVEALVEAPAAGNPTRAKRLSLLKPEERSSIGAVRDRYLLKARFDQFRQRAAILHTDAALLSRLPLGTDTPKQRTAGGDRASENTIDVRSADGMLDSFQLANPNWFYARDMLDAISTTGRTPIVAQWYRAIAAHYASHDNLADAFRHFEQARLIVPDDPGVLYGEACFQETLGSPSVQNFSHTTVLPNGYTVRGVFSPQTHFRTAETLLVRALAGRPDFVDAHLRLGRVLSQQGRFEAALPHFAQVIAATRDAALLYYARLFAGDAALALNRLEEARQSYESALAGHPNAQAARIGLAATLRAGGDRQAAIDALLATISVPAGQRDGHDDPWWDYYKGDAANVERLLDELRAPFSKPAR